MTSLYTGCSLLPDGATAYERAQSLTSAEARDVDAEAIVGAFDPWTCPAALLPWLAHTFSLDFWRDEWSETKKRTVVARAIELHFVKGTEKGLREYIALADAEVVTVKTPPQTVFSGPEVDQETRNAWLEALPQVRIWTVRETGEAGCGMFCGVSRPLWNSFFETDFALPTLPSHRFGSRARYVVGGVETDVPVTQDAGIIRLHLRSDMGAGIFSNANYSSGFYITGDADRRVITISPDTSQPWRQAVNPQLIAVSAAPDRMVVPGLLLAGVYSGGLSDTDYFDPGDAEYRIFDRYAIHDGSDVAKRPPDTEFMGVGQFGMPPHTAEVRVSLPGFRPDWAAGEGIQPAIGFFWEVPDPDRIERLFQAVKASMRHSDRILMSFYEIPTFLSLPNSFGQEGWVFGP